jgi:hypothetical protein
LYLIELSCVDRHGPSLLEKGTREGDSPVLAMFEGSIKVARRVGLFGNAVQNGWYVPSKAKYRQETDSIQVP